jgi:hypothetical protein
MLWSTKAATTFLVSLGQEQLRYVFRILAQASNAPSVIEIDEAIIRCRCQSMRNEQTPPIADHAETDGGFGRMLQYDVSGRAQMRFGVTYGNHGTGTHVEDIVVYIRDALRAAGQEAYILPTLLRDGVNVLLELFTDDQTQQILRLRQATGARFIVVVSEFTDGNTFNSHITSGVGHYVDKDFWKARFDNFLKVAAEAEAIWSLSELGVSQYQRLFSDKPVLAFPIGFDPLFPEPHHASPEQKDIDLLFTGSETPHRKTIIDELSKSHYVLTLPVTTLNASRIDVISRAKATLHINLSADQLYSSVMRHHFLLMNASSVLSERAALAGPLDEFITQFDTSGFVHGVSNYLASGEWKRHGVEAYRRYRENRPLKHAIKQLLAESFGSLSNVPVMEP